MIHTLCEVLHCSFNNVRPKAGVTHTACLPAQKHNEINRATLRPNKETVLDKPFETSPLKCSHAVFCLSSLLLGRRRLEDYRFKANLVSNRLIIPYLLFKKRGFQKQYGSSWRRSSQIKCLSTVKSSALMVVKVIHLWRQLTFLEL